MTKQERMAVLLWSEEIHDEKQRCDYYFDQLQQLTRDAGLVVCCSASVNRDRIQGTPAATRADVLYVQYTKANAKYAAMMSLLGRLSEVSGDPLQNGRSGWLIARGPENRKEQ